MIPRGLFVAGADTGAGKTVLAAGLLRALHLEGEAALAVKPVQTGVRRPADADAARYAEALEGVAADPAACARTLRSFRLAASPHLAARREGARLDAAELAAQIRELAGPFLLVEGAGGVLAPLNERETMLDLMEALGLPVLLAARNRLGALNHILLSLHALRMRGLEAAGVACFSFPSDVADAESRLILGENLEFLRAHADVPALWEVPCRAALTHASGAGTRAAWEAVGAALRPLARDLSLAGNSRSHEHEVDLPEWDRRHLWHPYASATRPSPVLEAVRAEGTRIFLRDGRALVDGMASWWCAVHGYGNPRLIQAARRQVGRMAHVMFGGFTHAPAARLGRKLLPLLPRGLERIFWADSGSVAVEVALKMALQYHQSMGRSGRTRFLAPLGGYHGDTFGAMSVCDPVNGMHGLFQGTLARQIFVPRPPCRFDAPFDPACMAPVAEAMDVHARELAAVILEPVVQGAGGMWFYHPEYLRRMRALCDAHGVLLIFDEIATGFGRTGRMFAAEWAGAPPDILCLGKALTGGVMSLAAAVCTEDVAQGACAGGQVFMHGPTFMGNALACAVAEAAIEELLVSPWRENVARLERGLREGLAPCAGLPGVADVRVLGGIGVVETERPVAAEALRRFFVERGVWIRPFARLIYLMPPFVATDEDTAVLADAVTEAVRQGVHMQSP